jgi:hypothetical protein
MALLLMTAATSILGLSIIEFSPRLVASLCSFDCWPMRMTSPPCCACGKRPRAITTTSDDDHWFPFRGIAHHLEGGQV